MKTNLLTSVTCALQTSSLEVKILMRLIPILSHPNFHQQRHFEFFRF